MLKSMKSFRGKNLGLVMPLDWWIITFTRTSKKKKKIKFSRPDNVPPLYKHFGCKQFKYILSGQGKKSYKQAYSKIPF